MGIRAVRARTAELVWALGLPTLRRRRRGWLSRKISCVKKSLRRSVCVCCYVGGWAAGAGQYGTGGFVVGAAPALAAL